VSACVSARGRVFYIADEGPVASVALPPQWKLVARDAFNGTLLWKRPIKSWEGHLRNFRSGPADLARRLVAEGETVYVTLGYGEPVVALDAATGKTIREYPQTANALEIILCDGALYVVAGDRSPDNVDGAAVPRKPAAVWHWWPIYEEKAPRKRIVAADAATGAVLWTKVDEEASTLMPTALAAAGGRVFFQNHESVVALDAKTGAVHWRAPRPVDLRRPTWSAPTLVVRDGVVLSADRAADAPAPGAPKEGDGPSWVVNSLGGNAPQGSVVAFSAGNGKRLWEAPCRECYNAPVDVLVADGLVWSGNLVRKNEPGVTKALDLLSGEVRRERPRDQTFFKIVMSHHRCYRNRATSKWLILGRDGIEFIDTATGKGFGHAWVRGSCQYGVMPANGLIYAPPHSCACHIESKLNGFNALAPAPLTGPGADPPEAESRTQRGPAFGSVPSPDAAAAPGDWPTHRHDGLRSGRASSAVPPALVPAWEARVGGGRTSAPVVAGGTVLVSRIDAHEVCALDADSGEERWRFTTGGRVDSPPTYVGGAAIFGSADGWVYCLRASDGALAWRFRAAPGERRIVSYDRLESAWPVHGSVLARDGVVYAVAGRSGHLDGGMRLCRIEAATGRLLSETRVDGNALPDVLSCDGESVFMRHLRFDLEGARGRSRAAPLQPRRPP
jgi:outer membrane protein assembly factor BamB